MQLWRCPLTNALENTTVDNVALIIAIIRADRTQKLSKDGAYYYRRSSVVCVSVCLSITVVSPAKTDEPIEVQFRGWNCWAR